ncbi:hypothetical protein SAMN05518670_0265 [Paenibacillus sp. OK076]|nr:hypothetical protein SAMN05518670_0265 [Paenibacillus sp. OK076]
MVQRFKLGIITKQKEQQIIGNGPIICCSTYVLWTKSANANESVIEILKVNPLKNQENGEDGDDFVDFGCDHDCEDCGGLPFC